MSCKQNEMQIQKLFDLIVCVHIVVSVISSMFSPEMMSCQTDMKVNLSLAKDLLRKERNTWSNRILWNYNIGGIPGFFSSKKNIFFASFSWKSVQICKVEWMGRNFDVFSGFQEISCYAYMRNITLYSVT